MKFIDFQNQLTDYPVFSLVDAKKIFGDFSYRQLDRWAKKGYLKKVKKGFYCFSSSRVNQDFLFYIANKIYAPSYISLEMALRYYGLIPEEIFQVTSVSTKKTAGFETLIGNFRYSRVKPSLYFGYRLVEFGGRKLLLAEPEKALLDYLYINARLKTASDLAGMRINVQEFRERVNLRRLQRYLAIFDSKALAKRVKIFLTTIQNDSH